MSNDYRNTKYCPNLENIDVKKEQLSNKIKKEHPRLKIFYNEVKKNNNLYKKEFMEIYNYKCGYCGNSIDNINVTLFEIDHYICESSFQSKEVAGKIENLVLACYDCNRSKKDFIIEDTYKNKLNPDLTEIKEVFIRDDNYYIQISEEYKNDEHIKSFYDKLKLGYEVRRLDFLLMNIRGLCKAHEGEKKTDKLNAILIKLEQKRNLTNCR